MKPISAAAIGGYLFLVFASVSTASDLNGRASSAHRELKDCMSKRMAVSRQVFYNEAAKACRDQIKARAVAKTQNMPLVSSTAAPTTAVARVE